MADSSNQKISKQDADLDRFASASSAGGVPGTLSSPHRCYLADHEIILFTRENFKTCYAAKLPQQLLHIPKIPTKLETYTEMGKGDPGPGNT